MSPLFPPEIVDRTTESLFVERKTRTSIIYIMVIVALLVALGSLPFIDVAITSQSRGIIRSARENNRIASPHSGRIEWISIRPNQPVIAGDTLLMLNTDKLDEEMAWYRKQIQRNQACIRDLELILSDKGKPQTLLYQTHYAQYRANLKKHNHERVKARKEFQIHRQLHQQQVIADRQMEEKKYLYELASYNYKTFREETRLKWQNELETYRLRMQEQRSMMERLKQEKSQYTLTAPVNGIITEAAGLQPGNFVAHNQMIAEISPEKDLMVECYISPADIGMIRDSMAVRFQFDAFNHNQWGLGTGRVQTISPDVITKNDQPVFRVRCSLASAELKLNNGYIGRLKKGMTLTARFQIARRNLFQLLYDKVDNWLNPKLQPINHQSY